MFGWFKKKKSAAPAYAAPSPAANAPIKQGGDPVLAFVLLDTETFPFAASSKLITRSPIGGANVTDVQMKDEMLSFNAGDEMCVIAHMPAPFPWSDLEGPCRTAWMWPPEKSPMSLKDHKTHLIVTLMGGAGTAVERRLMMTEVVGRLARVAGVAGIYWGDATLVHDPSIFADMAEAVESPEAPPLFLWVDFRVFKNDDGSTGLFTHGLAALGHMEIEFPSIEMDPLELRDWTVNIAYYLLEGPVLKDGDTMGVSAEHKVRIRHAPSRFGHEGKVLSFGGA